MALSASKGARRGAMAVVLLLAFFLRVHRIGEQRVWWDEGWSVWVARFAPLDILRQTGNDVHPPLYFELLHLWRLLSGDEEAALRLLSAFLGLLAVAATYALGRRMARNPLSAGGATLAGILAALFLSVSRFAVAWSMEIRMYALATLLAVLSVWWARQFWEHGRRRDAALYVLATAAGLHTLYLFAPVWAAVNLAWLWDLRAAADRWREIRRWLGLQLLILALFLPWAWYAAGGFLSTASATPIRLTDFLHIYWTVLTVGIPVDVARFNRLTLPAAAVFLGAIAAVIGSVRGRRARTASSAPPRLASISAASRRDATLLLVVLLLPAVIVYLISLPKQNFYNPPFNPRYLVIFTPFYSILLAWGLAAMGEWVGRRRAVERGSGRAGETENRRRSLISRLVVILPAVFMIAVALVGLWPYYPGRVLVDDYPSLASTIAAYHRPGDGVVLYTDTDWPIFAYHYPGEWRGAPNQWDYTPQAAAGFLAPIWSAHDAVWLVTTPYSAGGDPQRHVPAWLADRATAVREFAYQDMALTLYARTAERAALADAPVAPAPRPLDVLLPSGGRLVGYSQAARDFKSGDIIHLFLYRTGSNPSATEVGLMDDAGNVWQPTPVTLSGRAGESRHQVDLLVPPEAPSGRYRFYVRDESLQPAPFGALTIRRRQTEFLTAADVAVPNRVDAAFADGIRLLGYGLPAATARPGETVPLTLYWSSDGDVRQRYKVFTHLLGDVFNAATGNFLWGQADNEPAGNTRPTTGWRGAEIIVDEYAIPVAADAPAGAYRIEVGLYDPVSGQRLPVLGPDGAPAGDHLILATVAVE